MDVIAKRLTERVPRGYGKPARRYGIRVEIQRYGPFNVLNLIGRPEAGIFGFRGQCFMEGRHLRSARRLTEQARNQLYADRRGGRLFGDMTANSIGKSISINLDGQQLMEAKVEQAIYGGSVLVTGSFTNERAENIALSLQSGALPLELRQDKLDTISATLVIDALTTSVKAAIVGILLVMDLMACGIGLRRIVADWASAYTLYSSFCCCAVVPGIQLTLPASPYRAGIAWLLTPT